MLAPSSAPAKASIARCITPTTARRFASQSVSPRSASNVCAVTSMRAVSTSRFESISNVACASPSRSRPLSSTSACMRSPSARCASNAHTVESTPPLTAHSARPPSASATISALPRSMNASVDHQGVHRQIRCAKLDRIAMPSGSFCSTWNCTP